MRTELENSDVLSEFGSVRAKDVRTLSLEKFVEKVRSNLFRDSVEEYRRLRTLPGHEAEAKRIKDNMPCIVPAGICRGGHAVANLVSHSGLCCIDLDHTGERTGEIRRMAAALPYVCIVFTSISGEGVKLLVRVNVDDVRADYPTLYAAVGRAVSQAVRHPYDDKCKILTQPCFYSWDPDAYYNPDAVPFTLPDAAAPVAVALPDAPPPPSAAAAVALPARATDTGGFLVHFLDDFERRHPFRRGDRHDRCLQLGRVARSKGFSYEELEQLLALLATRYAAGDFSVAEMRQTVMAGYQYVAKVDQGEEKPSRVHLGSGFTLNPKFPASEEDNTEDLLEKNNAVYAETPTFPEWVYGTLPNFLQDCCDRTKDPRERDVLLMGCLVACSVLFPRVSFFYRNQCVSPHFYFALTAPAGTGKGMLGFTTSLLDATQDHYLRKLKEQRKRYE